MGIALGSLLAAGFFASMQDAEAAAPAPREEYYYVAGGERGARIVDTNGNVWRAISSGIEKIKGKAK